MTRNQLHRLLTVGLLLTSSAMGAPAPIADADIPKIDPKSLISCMTPLEGTTPAQWRVVWTGDASREATISWSTAEAGTEHRILYGTEPDALDQSINCQRNGVYTISKRPNPEKEREPAHYHHARLTDLKPDTRYYFVMESNGERSRTLRFRTAPTNGTDFSIIHGGDSRTGHADRCRMNLRIAAIAKNDPKVLAFAHGGDYISSGRSWFEWRLWLSQHELTTTPDGRVLPIIPTYGNHDVGPIYFETFGLDPESQRWHTTTFGKDITLVTLDTNSAAGGDQQEWLENQLVKHRPTSRWLLVQYHRPMYPAVKRPADQAPIFCPLFDAYNVDLALESDGHCMKRTVPIRDGKFDPKGLIYVGEGGLGVGQRRPAPDHWYFQDGGKVGADHHVMRLDFSPDNLRIRFILMNGSTWDDHTIPARKR